MTEDLGGVRLDRIGDGPDQTFDFSVMLPDATRPLIERAAKMLGARYFDRATLGLRIAFNGYLVRAGGLTILVDTCIGDEKHRPTRPGWNGRREGALLQSLQRAGVTPDDIDLVLCTHLHADHVGWNTRLEDGRWVPTFRKARYLMGRVEFDHWQGAATSVPPAEFLYGSFADSVLPVVAHGQADFVEDGHSIGQHLRLELIPGHTPGNLVIHVDGKDGRAVLSGDVLHHPVQLVYPDWSTRFCVDPALSRLNRLKFLDRFADTGTLICPAHFVHPTIGRITRGQASGGRPSYGYQP